MEKTTNFHLNLPTPDEYFDVEHQNENFRKIDDALQEEKAKIGDIKITTRIINEPNWLLCANTKITEDNYPKLYHLLSSDTNIFKGEWNIGNALNNGKAPIYSSDGFIYFVEESSVSRCKTDFSDFETFTPLTTLTYFTYENGFWFVFMSNGTVHYSSDCFIEDMQTININENCSPAYSFVRYSKEKWHIIFSKDINDDDYQIYESDSISGPYIRTTGRYFDDTIISGYADPIDIFSFKNGADLVLYCYSHKQQASGSYYHYARYVFYPNGVDDNNNYTVLHRSDNHTDINQYPRYYFSDIDSVFIWNNSSTPMLLRNDGSACHFYIDGFNSIAYFKGHIYLKTYIDKSPVIRRYNCEDLSSEYILSQDYITSYKISASFDRLFMPKNETELYFIENLEELSIPETHPGTIFKTYIKAK